MKKLYINVEASRSQVCLVSNGEMEEYYIEHTLGNNLVGNIYKGKILNIISGMDAGFVSIGLDKNAYLHVGDTLIDKGNIDKNNLEKLNHFNVKAEDEVICQVVKEQFGQKGARITLNISIPGKNLVLVPQLDYISISRKIECEDKRAHLENLVRETRTTNFGYILRTSSAGATDEDIISEIHYLANVYKNITNKFETTTGTCLLYNEFDLINRTLRDLDGTVSEVFVNDKKLYDLCIENPINKNVIFEFYDGSVDIFSFYGISQQIEKLLKRKVVLKNGANIIIEKTEALTVIDVNTGKYVGENNFQNTIFLTNQLAAQEIARQIKLRNIGGIIIVDFIDMEEAENRDSLVQLLKSLVKEDRTKTTVVGMTGLGLIEITRKKTRGSIYNHLLQSCPYCNGDSYVHSAEYVIMKLKQEIEKAIIEAEPPSLIIKLHPTVFTKIFAQRYLEKDSAGPWKKIRIYFIPDESLHIENYTMHIERNIVLELPNNAKMLY